MTMKMTARVSILAAVVLLVSVSPAGAMTTAELGGLIASRPSVSTLDREPAAVEPSRERATICFMDECRDTAKEPLICPLDEAGVRIRHDHGCRRRSPRIEFMDPKAVQGLPLNP